MRYLRFNVKGKFACFSNPVHKASRVTYDIPTPSALIGIAESIYWHPGVVYKVNKFSVLKPIRKWTTTFNELKFKPIAIKKPSQFDKKTIGIESNRTQRQTTMLTDVEYAIELSVESENEAKAVGIAERRIKNKRVFRTPYLGMRELIASVSEYDDSGAIDVSHDFGMMLHHIDYVNRVPVFYHSTMENGTVNVSDDMIITV